MPPANVPLTFYRFYDDQRTSFWQSALLVRIEERLHDPRA